MLKVIYAIDEEYPNESERKKAWRFASLMGRFSYGYGAEDKFIEIRNELKNKNDAVNYKNLLKEVKLWNITAGEYEYYKLRFHVMAQHEITSRPATCFPDFITEGMKIPNTEDRGPIHPYERVWKDYFEKFDSESNFTKEWERLYKKYVNIPNDVYDELKNKYELFADYSKIENEVKEFLEVDLKDYIEDNKIEPIYSDFAHQQILTAAITLEDATADKLAGDGVKTVTLPLKVSSNALDNDYIKEKYMTLPGAPLLYMYLQGANAYAYSLEKEAEGTVKTVRTSLAGWLGDIRLADSKMSEDDYKADLDGLNISNLVIKEDINTIEAINEYYSALECGTTTREKEFLCNMGNGDASKGYDDIKPIYGMYNKMFGNKAKADEMLEEFIEKIAVGLE